MAHPYHHALSSVRLWGGTADDYLPVHSWFDQSKMLVADFRHRALRHHAEGIFMAETIFGTTLALSTGRVIPVRWIGEQNVREDLGRIPSFADWAKAIRPEPWMAPASRLGVDDAPASGTVAARAAQGTTNGLIAALEDLLGDRPDIQHGTCVRCGRDYSDEPGRDSSDCPSEDCPGFRARAALAQAKAGVR